MRTQGLFSFYRNFKIKSLFTIFICSLLITGCASLGGTYPEDEGDICANQRGDLRRTEDYFVKQGITNVLGGAVIGAASGAIISAITGGDVGTSATIGAAAGAGAGLVKTLFESVNKENQQIDMATNAFNALSQCRFNAAEQVRGDFRSGRLSKPDAAIKLGDLKGRFNEDIAIANRIGAKISERSDQFQNNLVKEDPAVAPYLTSVRNEQQAAPVMLTDTNQSSIDENQSITSSKSSRKGSRHKKSSKPKVEALSNGLSEAALAKKQAAKNQIQSSQSLQAADATATNIMKAKNYKDSVKSVAQKGNFEIEGQLGLFILPKHVGGYSISWFDNQGKQCPAFF